MTVRVRIAPSPTGELHVGNARSGLFNWLFARHHGGVFILRIDDTDRRRSTPEYERENIESFRWLGLDWDEGIEVGGPHGTYRQSDRIDHYRRLAEGMVAKGAAYPCFCTPEELTERRRAAQKKGRPPGYDGRCRTIPPGAAADRRAAGEDSTVRLAIPRPGVTTFVDLVRGDMRFDHDVVDDFVLMRSDGSPTYHLASTVDDVDYQITHVARGEDLLSSTPKHIQLTEALGAAAPTYAHLPLLFGPDGKKLSKRHGDTAVRAYRQGGYLSEAVFNYLGLLGWSIGPDVTFFERDEAVAAFDLAQVSRNPAVFDVEKLTWMNGDYIRRLDRSRFVRLATESIDAGLGRQMSEVERKRLTLLGGEIQERVKVLSEVPGLTGFLIDRPLVYDQPSWDKVMGGEHVPGVLAQASTRLADTEWDAQTIEASLRSMLEDLNLSARKGLQPIRVAVTGSQVSPPLFESLVALGRRLALERIEAAADLLEAPPQ